MIERKKRELVHERVLKILPEYKEVLKILEELRQYIKDCCLSELNDSEREILEKYPEIVVSQPSVGINGIEIARIEKDENPDIYNLIDKIKLGSDYYVCSSDGIIPEWSFYTDITFDNYYSQRYYREKGKKIEIVPYLFKNWLDLKERYPEYYIKARGILIKGLEVRHSLVSKMKKLDETLSKNYINLIMLKKYYPELYKLTID